MAKANTSHLPSDTSKANSNKSLGTIGVATIFCTLIAAGLSFFGSTPGGIFVIFATAAISIILIAIFYFTPVFTNNVVLAPIPDLILVACVAVMAVNLKNETDFLLMFLIVALAISAFTKEFWSYVLTFLAAAVTLASVSSLSGWANIGTENVIIQLLSLVTFGVLFGILSRETNQLRHKEQRESERANQLLIQKRDIYLMIDNLSEGIIAVDQERNITLLNKRVVEILGLDKKLEHFIGKNIDDIFNAVSEEGKVSVVESALVGNKPEIRNDLKIVRNDLTVKLHSEAKPIIDEHKKPMGAIVLFKDVTAQSEMEEQRSEFLAIASHELRTPLTVIEGYLYYLTSDKSLKYDTKTKEYLDKTYSAAEDLIHLTNDILAVVKTEEGHMVVNLEKTDFRKLILDVETKFKDRAKKQGLDLKIDIPEKLPEILTDQQKITEAITNLVENALKFTEKGSVTIKAELNNKREIVTSVIDTGIGISSTDQQNVFKKFYRSEDWQTRTTGGTGLGLYITKTYLTRLGGKIGVTSKKGFGTTLWFSLPLEKNSKKKPNQDVQLQEFISNI